MPENKEHKACNLIRDFLRMRYLFCQNNSNKEIYRKQFQDCLFTIHETEDHINSVKLEIIERNKSKSLVMFFKIYFVLKLRYINNVYNFENEFKIATNYSMQFDDILENVCEKIHDNGASLNRKLDALYDVIIILDDILVKQKKIMDHIKDISQYNQMLMKYLLSKHNENNSEKNYFILNPNKKNKYYYVNSPKGRSNNLSLENTNSIKKNMVIINEEARLIRCNTKKNERVRRKFGWT